MALMTYIVETSQLAHSRAVRLGSALQSCDLCLQFLLPATVQKCLLHWDLQEQQRAVGTGWSSCHIPTTLTWCALYSVYSAMY